MMEVELICLALDLICILQKEFIPFFPQVHLLFDVLNKVKYQYVYAVGTKGKSTAGADQTQ